MLFDDENDITEPDEDEIIIRPKKAPVQVTNWKPEQLIAVASEGLSALREKNALVMCLTNTVSSKITADCALALGASPIMITDPGEAAALTAHVDTVLVNVGTLDKPQSEMMRAAVARANSVGKPWVLDPVGSGIPPLRTYLSKELMRRFPGIIRGNASEIRNLAGGENGARGVDSIVPSEAVVGEARRLAAITHAAMIVTGETDYVLAEANPVAAISNGSPLMTRVAGIGCAQGAFAAAFLATLGRGRRYEAAVAAALITAVAGDMAAAKAKAPGSFAVAFLDALYTIGADDLRKRSRLTISQ